MTCTGDPFRDRMALVRGGNSGVGASTALSLAGLEATVVAAGLLGRT